ncbi:hypothetical protein ABW20_dc0105195 [Dactylellina cionopaga]|nr:hypothetical protein ABW20_dc0105195 [Dactylellina cionopaga]
MSAHISNHDLSRSPAKSKTSSVAPNIQEPLSPTSPGFTEATREAARTAVEAWVRDNPDAVRSFPRDGDQKPSDSRNVSNTSDLAQNPLLLQAVEDAIKRLMLPQFETLKANNQKASEQTSDQTDNAVKDSVGSPSEQSLNGLATTHEHSLNDVAVLHEHSLHGGAAIAHEHSLSRTTGAHEHSEDPANASASLRLETSVRFNSYMTLENEDLKATAQYWKDRQEHVDYDDLIRFMDKYEKGQLEGVKIPTVVINTPAHMETFVFRTPDGTLMQESVLFGDMKVTGSGEIPPTGDQKDGLSPAKLATSRKPESIEAIRLRRMKREQELSDLRANGIPGSQVSPPPSPLQNGPEIGLLPKVSNEEQSSFAIVRPKGLVCKKCDQQLQGAYVRAQDSKFHLDCFRCAVSK